MEKLTIHRVLSELKIIGDRINKEISSLKPTAIRRGASSLIGSDSCRLPVSEDEFNNNAKSSYQSINDLIKRKFKLRSALLKANNSTTVRICDQEYTISEAIEMKVIMEYKKCLLDKITTESNRANRTFESISAQVDSDFERLLTPQISSLTNKSDISRIREEFKQTFYNQNTVKVVDPINVNEEIRKLKEEIDKFLMEVDSTLSEINAITVVEIND